MKIPTTTIVALGMLAPTLSQSIPRLRARHVKEDSQYYQEPNTNDGSSSFSYGWALPTEVAPEAQYYAEQVEPTTYTSSPSFERFSNTEPSAYTPSYDDQFIEPSVSFGEPLENTQAYPVLSYPIEGSTTDVRAEDPEAKVAFLGGIAKTGLNLLGNVLGGGDDDDGDDDDDDDDDDD